MRPKPSPSSFHPQDITGSDTKTAGLVTWNWLRIYNNACQEIGGINGVFANYLPVGVTSQLPYVLVLHYLSYTNYNQIAFAYGSFTFSGTPHCKRTTMPDGAVIHTCQKAFNC